MNRVPIGFADYLAHVDARPGSYDVKCPACGKGEAAYTIPAAKARDPICEGCLRHFHGHDLAEDRQFRAGRADRITCEAHCRDIARRIRGGDPTAPDAVRMLFKPPACAGCGEPLWAKRPDAKHHDAACVKRAQRARWATTNREGAA